MRIEEEHAAHLDRSNRAKVASKNPQGVDSFDCFGQVHWFHPNPLTIKNRCRPTTFSRVFTLQVLYVAFTLFHLNYLNYPFLFSIFFFYNTLSKINQSNFFGVKIDKIICIINFSQVICSNKYSSNQRCQMDLI